jgi:hypothetical protein
MVNKVKKRFENQTYWIFKSCVNHRREHRSWTYKLDKDGRPVSNDSFSDGNNHTLDCAKGFLADNPVFTNAAFKFG